MQTDWFLTLRSSVWSFLLHLVVAGLLIFSFELTPNQLIPPKRVNIIQAVSIDKTQVEQELKQLQDSEKRKREEEQKRQKELEKKTADEKNKAEEAKKKRLTEERKLAALNKEKERAKEKRELEQKRITQLEKEKKVLEEKRKLEEVKKREAEDEKQRIEEEKKKKEAELKRIEEEKRKKEAELKNIEEEKKRKAEEERKRKEIEQTLQNELAEEQKELEARQRGRDQSNIARYTDLITEKIQQNFNELGLPEGLSCILLIRMIPGGDVAEATIVKSSGNAIFDRRAENAVYAASPLPVPDENRLFELMRNLRITFEP